MKKIVVLGCGLMGKAMALDLAKDYDVTAVDINPQNLKVLENSAIKTEQLDLSKAELVQKCVKNFDLVVLAVPGFMGFQTLQSVIEAQKNVVDISFGAEDFFLLDDLAKKNDVTAVVDCGVAPGLGNIILGYHTTSMEVSYFECLVGGLPFKRVWPHEYKAPFSPIDVLEEYTRPARIVEHGQVVIKPALSETEYVHFDQVGTLETFNSDGLRTLLRMKIPNMKEKTMRYPGHVEYMKVLRETGFFSKDEVEINGTKIRPIDFTSKILFPKWKLGASEEEFTIMRVTVRGRENDQEVEYVHELFDRFCSETQTSSMARTTGYTCTGAARLVAEKHFEQKGICPPEYIGQKQGCYQKILDHLKERNVILKVDRKVYEK